jgi:hypothetical protein
MILIVLGESLVSVGLAAAAERAHAELPLILGALAGLSASAAMWWAYFAGEDEKAARAHERATIRAARRSGPARLRPRAPDHDLRRDRDRGGTKLSLHDFLGRWTASARG